MTSLVQLTSTAARDPNSEQLQYSVGLELRAARLQCLAVLWPRGYCRPSNRNGRKQCLNPQPWHKTASTRSLTRHKQFQLCTPTTKSASSRRMQHQQSRLLRSLRYIYGLGPTVVSTWKGWNTRNVEGVEAWQILQPTWSDK